MGTYTCCLCFTRRFSSTEVQPPADVRAAFAAHTEGATHMNADQLRRFLTEAQGEATPDDADRIIEQTIQLRPRQPFLAILSKPAMTVEDFYNYLFSEELNPPLRSQVRAPCPPLSSPPTIQRDILFGAS